MSDNRRGCGRLSRVRLIVVTSIVASVALVAGSLGLALAATSDPNTQTGVPTVHVGVMSGQVVGIMAEHFPPSTGALAIAVFGATPIVRQGTTDPSGNLVAAYLVPDGFSGSVSIKVSAGNTSVSVAAPVGNSSGGSSQAALAYESLDRGV